MKKHSFKQNLKKTWEYSFVRKMFLIVRAYTKLWWALIFTHNELSPLLDLDSSAMIAMSLSQYEKYLRYSTSVRDQIARYNHHKHILL